MTTFKIIFDKLVTTGATSKNVKTVSKKLTKSEREFVTKNFEKFETEFKTVAKKLRDANQYKSDKIVADIFKISVKKYSELCSKANSIAKCFNAGYNMGGYIGVIVSKKNGKITSTFGSFDNRDEYAKNSRFKAVHGYNYINLTFSQLEQIEIIGGVPTIKLNKNKIAECLMLVGRNSKHHYTIKFETGFVTSDFHGLTYQQCVNWRNNAYIKRLKQRDSKLATIEIEKRKKQALNKFVGFNHSIAVGNCVVGTKQFARKHNLNTDFGYRLDYLVSLEPNSGFVQRLFNNFV